MKPNRLATILSVILIGFLSVGWVIKDTANPFEVYTGSNTTPSISAAGTGAVTVGPATLAVQHKVEGTLKIDTNGSATTGLVMSINNQSGTPGTMLEVFSEGITSATRVVDFKNSNGSSKLFVRSDGAFGVATADVTFKDTNAGADNTNQTAAFARFDEDENRLHVGTGAAPSTTVALSGSFKNTGGNRIRGSAIFFNDAGGGAPTVTTTAGAETGNIVFYTKPSSGGVAIVGTVAGDGSWNLGPSAGDVAHVITGFLRIQDGSGTLSAMTFGAATPGLFRTSGGGTVTCTADCDAQETTEGFQNGSSVCLLAWSNANVPQSCGTSSSNPKCLCAGID